MAKTSLKVKAARKPKFKVRGYTRCQRCGRPKAVYRKFGLCRICLREMAHRGELPGVTHHSGTGNEEVRDTSSNTSAPKVGTEASFGPKPRWERASRP